MRCTRDCFNCVFDDCIKPESFSMVKSLNNKRYYERHKDKENARALAYAKSHREEINKRKRDKYDPEKRREYYMRWKAKMIKEQKK